MGACTLTADLDRFKGAGGAAGSGGTVEDAGEEEPPCEKGNCSGCKTCETSCLCSAQPALYDKCVADCKALQGDN